MTVRYITSFLVVTLAITALTGCHHLPITEASAPPVPDLARLPCCWQSEERITLYTPQGEKQLLAVVARQPEQLNLVVLDTLGQRLLTLRYRGDEPEVLNAPPQWDVRMSQGILVAVFLHHMDGAFWQKNSHWRVDNDGENKILQRGRHTFATLTYQDDEHNNRILDFPDQGQTLKVKTLRSTPLP